MIYNKERKLSRGSLGERVTVIFDVPRKGGFFTHFFA